MCVVGVGLVAVEPHKAEVDRVQRAQRVGQYLRVKVWGDRAQVRITADAWVGVEVYHTWTHLLLGQMFAVGSDLCWVGFNFRVAQSNRRR